MRKYRIWNLTCGIAGLASLLACASVEPTPEENIPADDGSSYGFLGEATSASGRMVTGTADKTGDLAVSMLDSGAAPDAGFLREPERMVETDRAQHPFQRVWVSPGHDRERYDKIVIAPVDIEFMLENSWWDNFSTATIFGLDGDVVRLASRFQMSVERAFRDDPNERFVVTENVDARTLILELALIEVVPNKSFIALGAIASMAATPVVSVPIGAVASRTEHGYVAIEGRVRDGSTGDVVAMFADRESAKMRVLDLQSLMWYGHAYEIFDEWAEQLVAVANRPTDPGVEDPMPFTLMPW
jgi:hypothetical protein